MEDDKVYNALMVISAIAIIIILTLIFTTKTTEEFTELYFEDHQNLPNQIQLEKEYTFQFSIHNLENEQTSYNYKISIDYYKSEKLQKTETLFQDSISLEHNQTATIPYTLILEDSFESAKIIVETNNQEIHFWVEEEE
ncbi:MAG: DUF1616 domain-containing protein [archaeon]